MKKRILCALLCIPLLLLGSCKKDGDGNTETENFISLFTGADTDYTVVYPEKATADLKASVTALCDAVEAVTGKKPQAVSEGAANYTETAKEIVVGNTSRAASAQALAKAPRGYCLEWSGEKLVIAGANDYLIERAVGELTASWKSDAGIISVSEKLSVVNDGAELVTSLLDGNGELRYRLILPKNSSDDVANAINKLKEAFNYVTGKTPSQSFAGALSDTEYEILIGDTGRDESKALYGELGYLKYQIKMVGKRIVIGATGDATMVKALEALSRDVTKLASSSYNGEYLMNNDYNKEEALLPWLETVPTVGAGTFGGVYDAADGTYVMSHTDIEKADYEAYIQRLKSEGYTLTQSYTLGNNLYSLMDSSSTCVYVSYLAEVGEIRVYAEKAGNAKYPAQAEATKGGSVTPAMWQLMTDFQGSKHNSGNSYVLQLTDGSFIVMDGGYATEAEAKQLYDTLVSNTPAGQKPVISAWFITHLHNDHYGCLLKFADKYSSKVDVKAFAYNYTLNPIGSSSVSAVPTINAAMKKWSGAVHYNKLHSGMSWGFADAKISVICTQEDVYPMTPYDANDTCLVLRADIGGQRIMFLADACESQSRVMSRNIAASELKSDIVTVAHHGYEGCLTDLYKKIDAHTAFWPMAIYGYKMDTVENVFETWMKKGYTSRYNYANGYLINESNIKKFFVSGAGTVKIELPYTPTGDRLPDYKAIFEEIKAKAPRS